MTYSSRHGWGERDQRALARYAMRWHAERWLGAHPLFVVTALVAIALTVAAMIQLLVVS